MLKMSKNEEENTYNKVVCRLVGHNIIVFDYSQCSRCKKYILQVDEDNQKEFYTREGIRLALKLLSFKKGGLKWL